MMTPNVQCNLLPVDRARSKSPETNELWQRHTAYKSICWSISDCAMRPYQKSKHIILQIGTYKSKLTISQIRTYHLTNPNRDFWNLLRFLDLLIFLNIWNFWGFLWIFGFFWIFFGFCGIYFFSDFFLLFSFFPWGFYGLFSKLLRLLLNITNVTTGHQKWPKMGQNSIISPCVALFSNVLVASLAGLVYFYSGAWFSSSSNPKYFIEKFELFWPTFVKAVVVVVVVGARGNLLLSCHFSNILFPCSQVIVGVLWGIYWPISSNDRIYIFYLQT